MGKLASKLKSFKLIRWFLWYVKVQNKLPLVLEIELDSLCNRKCTYCPNYKHERAHHTLSSDTYKGIIGQLHEMGWKGVISPHFYNEPLLDKRLEELLLYTKQKLGKRACIKLFTNGDLLTTELAKKWLFDSKIVDEFVVTVHEKDLSDRKDLVDLSKLPEYQRKLYVRSTENIEKQYLNRGGIMDFDYVNWGEEFQKLGCSLTQRMIITSKGNHVLCCNDYFEKTAFGNVSDTSIQKLWSKSKKTRKDTYIGNFKLPICKVCVGISKN